MQAKAALTRHLDTLLMSQEKKKKKGKLGNGKPLL